MYIRNIKNVKNIIYAHNLKYARNLKYVSVMIWPNMHPFCMHHCVLTLLSTTINDIYVMTLIQWLSKYYCQGTQLCVESEICMESQICPDLQIWPESQICQESSNITKRLSEWTSQSVRQQANEFQLTITTFFVNLKYARNLKNARNFNYARNLKYANGH